MPTATVNGVELYYELLGAGPPVLVIPGMGSDVRMFSPLAEELSGHFLVLVFDPRGSGRSGKPDGPYSIEQMADDAAGLLGTLGIGPATVAGYSMGGRIALALALRHPQRVDRLVLAATSARTPAVRPFTRRWFVIDVLGQVPLPRWLDPQPRSAQARQREASRAFDCTDQLGRLRVPTTVVHARHDHMTPLSLALELQEGIPGAQLVTVEGGHLALLTRQRRHLVDAVRAGGAPKPSG